MAKGKPLKSGLHALVWQEGKWFVAKCVEVEIASQGKSKQQAVANLEEALHLYFADEKIKTPVLPQIELLPLGMGYA